MQLTVIDISSWQHPNGVAINWEQVKADGIQGVIIKATQGVTYVNPYWESDYEEATKAGLVVGAYHFAEPGNSDAAQQAEYHVTHIMGKALPLGTWLDLEETGGLAWYDLQTWAETYVNSVHTPQAPSGIYTNLDYAGNLTAIHSFARFWLANPSGTPNAYNPYMIQTGQRAIAGIEGATDIDLIPNARGINPGGGGNHPPVPVPEPPTPPPNPADRPTLNQGTTGPAVTALQERLNVYGAGLAVDGNFGPDTHAGVVAFQSVNGLTQDGICGPMTWAKLDSADAVHIPAPVGDEPEITMGSTGPAVTLCQRLLNERGYTLTVDGIFGGATHAAVAAFQQSHNLKVDGIVGPATWQALRSAT